MALFLTGGVIFSYLRLTQDISLLWLILFLPFIALKFLFSKKWRRTAVAFLVLAVSFLIGFLAFSHSINSFQSLTPYDGEYTFTGTAIAVTRYDDGYKKVLLDDVYFHGERTKGKMSLVLDETVDVALSNEVSVTATVQTNLALFKNGYFRANDIFEKNCYEAVKVKSAVVIGKNFHLFREILSRVEKVLYAAMDKDGAAVMLGVLTGETSGMDWSLLQNVRYGGVAHLFAVSGLHVGAVFALCTFIFTREKAYKLSKAVRFFLLAAMLLFYGGVCGFSPSVVRAIVTCLCFYADNLIGLKKDSLETIGKAALVTILLQPVMLLSVGFQLSFAACLGIALLHRHVYQGLTVLELSITRGARKLFRRTDEWDERPLLERIEYSKRGMPPPIQELVRKKITSFLATCFAAQIGTLPIQLTAFGYISGAGLLLNCVFVPFISVAFSFLLAFTALASILPLSISPILLFAPKAVWALALLIFYAVDFSYLALQFILPIAACYSYVGFFLVLSNKLNISKRLKTVLLILFAVLTVFGVIFGNTL